MDVIYNSEERNDATLWNHNNPAQWMEPYNDIVYQAWCNYDGGEPMFKFPKEILSKGEL